MNLFAPEEALALYSRGLALLQQASDSPAKVELEMALQMAISDPLVVIQGWGAAEREQASQRAYELCKQSGNEQALIRALYLQADMLRARGRYARSLALGKQLLSLAEEAGAEAGLALAHWTLGETQFFRGKKAPARFHLTRALAHYTPPDPGSALRTSTDLGVVCQVWLSWLDALEGRPEQGEARLQEALALARRLAQPFTLSFAIFMGAYGFWWLRKDPQAADAYATEAAPLMMAEELAGIHPWGRLFQGWVLSESGALAEGIAMMEEGMDMWTEMGAVSGRSCQGLPLVRAYLQAEQREKARALTADILAMMEETGEQMFTEEWRRLARAVQTPEQ
jgi:tetratricopeptide (TPR) repeat protein